MSDKDRNYRGGGGGRGYRNDYYRDDQRKLSAGRGNAGTNNGPLKHMGLHPNIDKLLRNVAFNDEHCLKIIDPDITDRDDFIADFSFSRPLLHSWRLKDPVGIRLDQFPQSGDVRSNFFRVSTTTLPENVFQYNVSYFKLNANTSTTEHQLPEDIALKNDKFLNNNLIAQFLQKLDICWQSQGFCCGVAYDGVSTLYSTAKLPFPEDPNFQNQEDSATAVLNVTYDVGKQFALAITPFTVVICFTNMVPSPRDLFTPAATPTNAATSDASTTATASVSTNVTPADISIATVTTAVGIPSPTVQEKAIATLRAMDVALLSFARKKIGSGKWILNGNTVFSPSKSKTFVLSDQFVGMMGYHASFRTCISGLTLVKDVSVACFLKGGRLLDFVAVFMRCRESDLHHEMHPNNPRVAELLSLLKNSMVRLTHITPNMRKKLKGFSHSANDPASGFAVNADDMPITVAEYFQMRYKKPLKYPRLPTVNLGNRNRPVLLPMEVLDIVAGQTRQRSITEDVAGKLIKHAALKPNDRFHELTKGSFVFPALHEDGDAQHFGISEIVGTSVNPSQSSHSSSTVPTTSTATSTAVPQRSTLPMRVVATLLPPAKLLFGRNKVLEPQLRGAWNLSEGTQFAHPAPLHGGGTHKQELCFGAVLIHEDQNVYNGKRVLRELVEKITTESRKVGVPMVLTGILESVDHREDLSGLMRYFRDKGVRIVLVLLMKKHFYPRVKYMADQVNVVTQCSLFETAARNIRNYETNLMVKINMKMGGTNHTLVCRGGRDVDPSVFQQPPRSISWLFDLPAMVIGIDVNHPEPNSGDRKEDSTSIAAVVASMDGMLGQYCAHISACTTREEPVSSLYESFRRLLKTFCLRNNGQFPRKIIVYRDGVSDNQFGATLNSELTALRHAVEGFNYSDDDVKIVFIVCQKRHHTRFVYQAGPGEEYLNPCVGMCVDARGFAECSAGDHDDAGAAAVGRAASSVAGGDDLGCVVGSELMEFYLNSHAASLGTSKPTRYVLLHDEIGLKLSEVELLTFWLTHLYARCTKSVSITAPAYYAHWAARRGRVLLSAGLPVSQLGTFTSSWMEQNNTPGLYFI